MAEPLGALTIGTLIADTYEITRLLGRGGMGEVWLATHRRLPGKQVAIKVLHTKGLQLAPEALTRFRREAEVATRIGHPNIVEVHDFNTLPSGEPYLVLEFLAGESLAQRLRHGPMSLDDATTVVRQVASALDASHQIGVVHRDLKPDNIFLITTQMGLHVKVLDFGISKIVDSTTVQTQDAILVGTPQYMSPEQAIGANKDVGPQTDIFALGSITYEMLGGRPPFAAESIAKMVFQIAYEPHVPLAQLNPALPERMVQAVEKALLKDRALRYRDVAQFAADFSGQAMTRPPYAQLPEEPSGVATPGSEGPESLMLARTAARTPAPLVTPNPPARLPLSATGAAVAAPQAPAVAAKRSLVPIIVAAIVVIGGGGFAVSQLMHAEPVPVPLPPPVVAVVDAGTPVVVAVVEPAIVDAGEPSIIDAGVAVAIVEHPAPYKPAKLSPADQARVNEVLKMIATDPTAAMRRAEQLRRGASDELAAALAVATVRAACASRDPQAAVNYFQRVENPAAKRELRAYCARALPNLTL